MKLKINIYLFLLLQSFSVIGQKKEVTKLTNEEIVEKYLKNGAWKYPINWPEWQLYLDSAIALKPGYAYLYQQKAMPYFKQDKYEVAIKILDKAVETDVSDYIDYRAFMKCIFGKRYREAIDDFLLAKKTNGENGFVMDHSYDFYIGLCYIQLNEFEKAIPFLNRSITTTERENGSYWVHWLDYFYIGIALYELQKHNEAISYFDKALANNKNLSDAKYYKTISLFRIKKIDDARKLIIECDADFKSGHTINEGNSNYERYPYQINQELINLLKR